MLVRYSSSYQKLASYQPQTQGLITAEHTRLLSPVDIAAIGMGWFFSIRGIIALCVVVLGISSISEDIEYSLKDSPIAIENIATVTTLKNNDYVKLSLPLDYGNGIHSKTVGGMLFSLIPVVGAEDRLIVFREGVLTTEEAAIAEHNISGRVIERGFTDEWNTGYLRLKVDKQFERAGMVVQRSALLIVDGYIPRIEVWPLILLVLFTLLLVWFLLNVTKTIAFFRNRDVFAEYLNRKLKRT